MAQGEEDEPTLLMAHAVISTSLPSATSSKISVDTSSPRPRRCIDVHEDRVFVQLGTNSDLEPHRWVLDTGATNHMTGARSAFSDLDIGVYGTVRFGDGSVAEIEGIGTVLFNCKNGEHRALTGVFYLPRLTANIISVGQLDEGGCRIELEHGVLRIYEPGHKLLARIERSASRLYLLNLDTGRPICLSARSDQAAWHWHARFGHLRFQSLRRLAHHDTVRGLPHIDQIEQVCEACLAGKQHRAPFPDQARRRVANVIELVYGDICRPISPTTSSGNQYFLLLVDDMSRFMWLVLLPSKDEAPSAIKNFQAVAEVETGRKLKALRTDRGGEFTSVDFGRHCAERGVQRQLTAPYSPQQNGVVEWRNQSVVAMARCMLKDKHLPSYFWGEAVTMAVHILNRAPTRALDGQTPFEAWHGEKPPVHYFRTFGCIGHVKETRPHPKKLDDRSTPMIFVGYEGGSKAWRFYDPNGKRVTVSRDVVFDEAAEWQWNERDGDNMYHDPEPFVIERTVEGDPDSHGQRTPTLAPSPDVNTPGSASQVEFSTPPPGQQHLDVNHDDDVPLRFRTLDNLLDYQPPPGLAVRQLDHELHFSSAEEPSSFKIAQQEPCWKQAMEEEMRSINDNHTWELVDLPPGHRAIGLKWVYKVKRDEAGNVIRHKARLVAKGYVQRAGIDYKEVFAPVARIESV